MRGGKRVLVALCFTVLGCRPGRFDPDAGGTASDAAESVDTQLDAGPLPERPTLAVPCTDTADAVYAALPDMTIAPLEGRGQIRACTYDGFVSEGDLAVALAENGTVGVTPTTGMHVFRIAYQTTRSGDVAAVSSARVLVPATLARTPSPQLVSAHGTTGLADICAPSRFDVALDDLALPFAASGWPVISPDYAGLGTAGTQGYGDNEDTGRSQLDGARALRSLLPAGTLTDTIVMDGHSQGGGTVLSAQAIERTYGAGGDLGLVIAFAPGWPIERDATGYRFPRLSTRLGGGASAAISALALHAWHANALGEARAGEAFAAPVRAEVVDAIETQCVFQLAESIPGIARTYGDLFDETLRTGIVSCADGGACSGTSQQMWDWMATNILHGDPSGARLLVYTGTEDTLATPEKVSCILAHLAADGLMPDRLCVDTSTHFDVVAHGAGYAISYANAFVDGASPPACPTSGSLPACP